ncbi:MAG: hypothetical protein ACPGLV_18895 [Bacteroidia bacterium]
MKSVFTLLVISLATSTNLFAQSGSLSIDKNIKLNVQSITQYIEIDVPEVATNLLITVYCSIKSGSVEAILLDPNGRSMGKLKLGSKDNKNDQSENGKLNLTFKNAQLGTWKIKVVPSKTEGNLRVSSMVSLETTNE